MHLALNCPCAKINIFFFEIRSRYRLREINIEVCSASPTCCICLGWQVYTHFPICRFKSLHHSMSKRSQGLTNLLLRKPNWLVPAGARTSLSLRKTDDSPAIQCLCALSIVDSQWVSVDLTQVIFDGWCVGKDFMESITNLLCMCQEAKAQDGVE